MRKLVFIILVLPCAVAMSQEIPVRDPALPEAGRKAKSNLNMGLGLPRSIDGFNWVDNLWDLHQHTDVTYDNNGEVTSEVITYATGEKYRYTYDWDEESEWEYCDQWVAGEWVPISRERWDFHPLLGFEVYYIREEFVDGAWKKADEWSILIELFNNRLWKETYSEYNAQTGATDLTYRYTYEYYPSGQVQYSIGERYQNGQFSYMFKDEFFWLNTTQYDHIYAYSYNNNAWKLTGNYVYNYKDTRSYQYTYYWRIDELSPWNPSMRGTHTFDSWGTTIAYYYEQYMNALWTVIFGNMYGLTYVGSNLVQRITQEWQSGSGPEGTTGGDWVNTYKEEYSNFLSLGTENPAKAMLAMNCYPVPAGDHLSVEITSPSPAPKTLVLTNLTGQCIRSEIVNTLSSSITWDISDLPSGMYLVRLYDQSASVITRKIVKD